MLTVQCLYNFLVETNRVILDLKVFWRGVKWVKGKLSDICFFVELLSC